MNPDPLGPQGHQSQQSVGWRWLLYLVCQPAAVYAYLCLPRLALVLCVPSSELHLTRGFLDQTLAYVGVLLSLDHLLPAAGRRIGRRIIIVWLHLDFLLRCGEAALMYQFDIGYSSLFFYHLELESARLALSQHWLVILVVIPLVAGANWILGRLLSGPSWQGLNLAARAAVVVVMLFGIRSVYVLHRERHRLPEDFAAASFVLNWREYLDERSGFQRVSLTQAERDYVRTLGIRLRSSGETPRAPSQPINLVTIYLEGFQANFTQAGQSPFPGLTPNLDRFASNALLFGSFYNAVTPTINAIISSQCGILSHVENGYLDTDRGYTRNLSCLSDLLHGAGYHQVFMGGADSGFSGKRLFLTAHHYDEVWGWERWRDNPLYRGERRSEWGLHDTDLVREAIARLPDLRAHAPFHLSLLTVNTHEPGYQAPDCSEYQPGRTMLNAIHCSDHAVGMLMDALETGGDLSNTAVAVMGDHLMFPTAENAAALGPAADAGWFGKVVMALYWPGGPRPGRIDTPAYTPDFAPIVLDALGFRPVPRFAFGRSMISSPDRRRTLVAAHFQILNGRMIPTHPSLADECTADMLEHTILNTEDDRLSPCGREKIIDTVEQSLLATAVRTRSE